MSNTKAKPNKKKVLLVVGIFAVIVAIFAGAYIAFGPSTTEGSKEVVIEVVDDQEKTASYTVNTDAEYLRQAMEEAEGLTFEGDESEYGLMLYTVNGVTADYNVNASYWAVYVGDEYATNGIDTQPVEDGQTYRIVYTTD